MITLTICKARGRTVNRHVPEEWNELQPEQLLQIAALLHTEKETRLINVRLVQIIFSMTKKEMHLLQPEQVTDLVGHVQWIHKGCDLTVQLLPALKVRGELLYGPDDYLQNLLFCEFDAAERELYRWQEDMDNQEQLYRFLACLYRPGKKGYDHERNPDGDPRIAYNANLLPFYAKKLAQSVPVPLAIAVTMWYKGCRQHIVARFPELFDISDVTTTNTEPQYFELMRAMAKEQIYGDFEKVEQLYLYTALTEIVCAIRDQKETPNQNHDADE